MDEKDLEVMIIKDVKGYADEKKRTLTLTFSFLELPWDDSVMHHEQQINKKGGISLSKVQR